MNCVVDGQLVNYQDEGKGEVILMLHGWGADLHNFDDLAKHFRGKFRVVRLDFPGFGSSSVPPEDWTVGSYAEFTAKFLEKLKIKKPKIIVVHSFGGRVALKGIGMNLFRTDKLVLMDSGGIKRSDSLGAKGFKVIAKTGKHIVKLPGVRKFEKKLRRRLYEKAGSTDYVDAGPMKKVFLNVIGEDMREFASKVTCPTLILWGEKDVDTPVADADIFHQKIKGSKLVVVPYAGHFVHLDAPDPVTHIIEEFVK